MKRLLMALGGLLAFVVWLLFIDHALFYDSEFLQVIGLLPIAAGIVFYGVKKGYIKKEWFEDE